MASTVYKREFRIGSLLPDYCVLLCCLCSASSQKAAAEIVPTFPLLFCSLALSPLFFLLYSYTLVINYSRKSLAKARNYLKATKKKAFL